jgi:hypothetical protein
MWPILAEAAFQAASNGFEIAGTIYLMLQELRD